MHRISLALGLVLSSAASAGAGGYSANSVYPGSGYYAPAQQFFYFVGQPVRIEALVEAEKRSDPDYRLFLEFKKFREEFDAYRLYKDAKRASDVETTDEAAIETVLNRCATCHSGAAPEGGLFLDGRHRLTPAQITAAQRRVLQGEMPPGQKLSPEETGRVLKELLNLEEQSP